MKDNPVFWKQANGKLVSVDEMDTNHLRNVLKMIISNDKNYCKYCNYIVDTKYPHRNMCPNNYINSDYYSYRQVELNGDMANEFNDSHPSDEDDLDYRFNDDESRGNQW